MQKGHKWKPKTGILAIGNAKIFTSNMLNKLITNDIIKCPYFRFKSTKDGVERK